MDDQVDLRLIWPGLGHSREIDMQSVWSADQNNLVHADLDKIFFWCLNDLWRYVPSALNSMFNKIILAHYYCYQCKINHLFKKLKQLIINLYIKTKINKIQYSKVIKWLGCGFVLFFMVSVVFIWLMSSKNS